MQWIQIFAGVTVFSLMLTIGLNQSLKQLVSVWKQPDVLIRAFLAVIVLVPLTAILLLRVFDLTTEVATGLAVLAASPAAPLTTKRSQMAKADYDLVSGLQLTLAYSAVFVTPLILAIFYSLFDITIEPVSPLRVASQVAMITFLPVSIGLLLCRFLPKIVETCRKPFQTLADVMFLLFIIVIIGLVAFVPALREKLVLGWPATRAILILAVSALIYGHVLGGPISAHRSGLAILTVARNVGLALYIVTLCEPGEASIPTILVYTLLGAGVAIPYSLWMKRQTPSVSSDST